MPSRMRSVPLVVLLSLAVPLAACGEDGIELPNAGTGAPTEPTAAPPDSGAPEPTDPPATEPPVTEAPAPEPTDPPATEPGEEDDGDGTTLWAILLIIIGIIAVAALITALVRRRPGSTDAAPAQRPTGGTTDPRAQMIATGRWMHDQLTLEVLTLPPADAQTRWTAERPRFDQLVINLRAAAPGQQSPVYFESLANAVANLQSSMDTAVRVRATPDSDPALAQEAVGIANTRRADLQRALLAAQQSL